MAKPFKFRYVNQIAGTFVGAIALVVLVSLVLVGRAQKWFSQVQPVMVLLPPDGSFGLKVGGEVRMMGVTVGAVDRIDPPSDEKGQMKMTVHVDPRFAKFIRLGSGTGPDASRAIIHIPLGIGDPFLEFTRGQGVPLPKRPTEPSLSAVPESGVGEAITQTVSDVRTRTLPAVQALVEQYTQLAAELRSQQGPVQHTLAHIDQLTANLERTDTVLGQLTADKTLALQLNTAIARLSSSADELHGVLADLQKTSGAFPAMADQSRDVMAQASGAIVNVRDSTAQLPAVMASLKQTVDTLPGVMAHTQQSLVEIERLVKGMEALPLIRDHVDATAGSGTLRPSDVGDAP
jgi:ABC-type transporter Mla subunit MlaD